MLPYIMLLTLHYSSHMHTYILYSISSAVSLCNTCITLTMPLCLHTHLICIYCTRYHQLHLAYAVLYHHSFRYFYVHILHPFTLVCIRYSGAKKYLVSHQLCKFSHLKRLERPVIFIIGTLQL